MQPSALIAILVYTTICFASSEPKGPIVINLKAPEFVENGTLILARPTSKGIENTIGGRRISSPTPLLWSNGKAYGDLYLEKHKQTDDIFIFPPGAIPRRDSHCQMQLHYDAYHKVSSGDGFYALISDRNVMCHFPSHTQISCIGINKLADTRSTTFVIDRVGDEFRSGTTQLAILEGQALTIRHSLMITASKSLVGKHFVLLAIVALWFRSEKEQRSV